MRNIHHSWSHSWNSDDRRSVPSGGFPNKTRGGTYLYDSISPEKGFVPNPVADGHLRGLDGLAPMQGFYPRQGHS